jgi:hypothetical protein
LSQDSHNKAIAIQVLHLVTSQCHASSLVTKVKLVERCFKDGVSVRFEMYELAPTDAPAPLPYFVKPDGTIVTDELELSKYLAAEGSPALAPTEGSADRDSLLSSEVEVNKTIKAACKSKTPEVLFRGYTWGAARRAAAVPSPTRLWPVHERSAVPDLWNFSYARSKIFKACL